MKIRYCPKCEFANPEDEWGCFYCGATLSQNTLIEDDNQIPAKISLLRDLHYSSDVDAQLQAIIDLTPYVQTDRDVFRYLKKLADEGYDPVVQKAAKRASQLQRAEPNGESFSPDKIKELHQPEISTEIDPEMAQWTRIAYKVAGSFLLVAGLADLGVGLYLGLPLTVYGLTVARNVFLAVFLFEYRPWARILTFLTAAFGVIISAIAVWGILQIILDPSVSFTDQVDGITYLTSLMQFGVSAALLITLNPRANRRSAAIGIGLFGSLYIVPFVIYILTLFVYNYPLIR